jgi:hypothetical protein
MLADFYREDPENVQQAIVDEFREVMPWSTCVAEIPGWDDTYTTSLGYTLEDLFEEGARMQEARLRSIGLPMDEIRDFPIPMDIPPRDRGARGIKLMRSGYIGPKHNFRGPDPAAHEILFDQMRRNAHPEAVKPGTVVQWSFTDAEPWHVVVDNGSTRAVQGPAQSPTLNFTVTSEDFADVAAGRVDPRKLMLRRRMRPSGDLRLLLRLPKLFP